MWYHTKSRNRGTATLVAPVVLGFYYEAHNVPAYKFINRRPSRPIMHSHTKFEFNRTIRGGIIAIQMSNMGAVRHLWQKVDFNNSAASYDLRCTTVSKFSKIEQHATEFLTIQLIFPARFEGGGVVMSDQNKTTQSRLIRLIGVVLSNGTMLSVSDKSVFNKQTHACIQTTT